MLHLLSRGLKLVMHNKRTLFIVSLYQLGWTLLLFFLVQRIVSPLMRALPDNSVNPNAAHYFWTEIKFVAAKTDTFLPYLYIFIGILLLRMIIAPFVQSGIFGTLASSNQHAAHNQFINQIKSYWKTFTLLYWVKMVAIIVPTAIVLTPVIKALFNSYFTFDIKSMPWFSISLLIIWTIVIKSLTYSLFIGITNQMSWQQSLINLVKKAFMLVTSLVVIIMISSILQGVLQLTSLFVAGFISSILFFIIPIIQTFMKAWTISTHTIQFNE